MEQLFALQEENGRAVQQIITNYKKDPKERKTLKYYEERLARLDEAWGQFETTDNDIRGLPEVPTGHRYFVEDYYSVMMERYQTYRKHFMTIITELRSAATKTGSETPISKVTQDEKKLATQADAIPKANSDNGKTTDEVIATRSEAEVGFQVLNSNPKVNHTGRQAALITKQGILIDVLRRELTVLSTDEQPRSHQFYQSKIELLERHWKGVQTMHDLIWESMDDLSGYEVDAYFKIEHDVQTMLVQLREKLDRQIAAANTRNSSIQSPNGVTAGNNSSPALPRIALPKFDGDYLKWKQFHDLFTEIVHNQPMADCQRMWYLKTSLTGEAEKLIRHLTVSEANYEAAWKIIRDRYENTRLLVTTLLNKLLSQPNFTCESASNIRNLHDTTQECLLGLENLDLKTTNWDPILLHLLIKKLDKNTHTLYEQSLSKPRELQSLQEFLQFLETRFQSLESLGSRPRTIEEQNKKQHIPKSIVSTATTGINCPNCKGSHHLYGCQKFLQLTPDQRLPIVKKANLCLNCLRPGHRMDKCVSRGCTKCFKRHNTLLHLETTSVATPQPPIVPRQKGASSVPCSHTSEDSQLLIEPVSLPAQKLKAVKTFVLLSTVRVILSNNHGTSLECRALLDSGSQLNFITERMVRRLGLAQVSEELLIEGIGKRKQQIQGKVNVLLQSTSCGFKTRLEAHVLTKIISPQPAQPINIQSWSIPNNISLADPQFNHPAEVDLLIGAELYYSILSVGQIKLGESLPTLQNTVFGWTVAGRVADLPQSQATCGICSEDEVLTQQIEEFWKLEDPEPRKHNFTATEKRCEEFFNHTTTRDSSGRFIVSLPFKDDSNKLGESKNVAFHKFMSQERKLARDPVLREQYINFMQEYIKLGHMEEIDLNSIQKPYYFLPHHSVLKPDSTTTKLRVVFNASAKTASNLSLNDILHTGPTIQDDVFSILLRFRLPRYVFTADIEKMYRQIKLAEADRKYQLIWWRNTPQDPLKCYQLNTVTYGTTSAPYLAIKCLQRLAAEQAESYPLGAETLRRHFYVDDLMTGSNSLINALDIQSQIQTLLATAGFRLRKWCGNHPRLLQNIPVEDRELQLDFNTKVEEHIKTVGLTWLPKTDSFAVRIPPANERKPVNERKPAKERKITKRAAYSDIAQLFDPLGIMGPVTVVAKMFLQKLWTLKMDWDASLPQDLHTTWTNFRKGLDTLNNIKFPRHVFSHRIPKSVQLHVFADASEKAYGAAAYIRAVDKDNIITVRLLCAKSRVAPIKQTTLPRLELCAAKLAAELADRIKTDLAIQNETTFLWTDSQITLAWINSKSSSFHTFVANRVSAIQELTIPQQWRHVSSKQNPADVLSRGIAPEKLAECNLWFYGPTFLHGVEALWPAPFVREEDCTLEKKVKTTATATIKEQPHFINVIDHRNSFRTLQRIVAYILRFINFSRNPNSPSRSVSRSLTMEELEEAKVVIIRRMQEQGFGNDLVHLKRFGEVSKDSPISSLTPFVDERGIIRVGGRLEEANLPYNSKHPILLPYDDILTKVLMNDIHKENLHIGPQALLSTTRQQYWPIKGKTIARSVVQHCLRCARAKPKLLTQLMGNLPGDRVQPNRPFVNSGVDFCGPIWTHYKGRGRHPQKTYIAVFCCFATKATHLEVVSDLSTQGFLNALKRFISRRGRCRNIYCDNASNFVGAKNQLEELKEAVGSQCAKEQIATTCSTKGIDFHFIPPRAPHFGGLWEAAVKSAKYLLQRTLVSATLTYEELETAVTEAEAILNSRPITPLSSDPNDLTALTPGHFLIGEPLSNPVDANARTWNASLTARWKLITHIKNEFWRRWSREYLNQLQHRYRWKGRENNIQPGMMVIIKEDNAPPLKWPLGRIIQTIKGNDGLVRVADVRTATGTLRRPIHRLAPLPVEPIQDTLQNLNAAKEGNSSNNPTPPPRNIDNPEDFDNQGREEGNSSNNPTSPPRKRARKSLSAALVTLLMTCLLVPTTTASPIEIKPFQAQSGVYFENLGSANMISSEWNIVAYYDMQTYWTEFTAIKNHVATVDKVCNLMNKANACDKMVNQLQHIIKELSMNNALIIPSQAYNRSRRGAINIVGNLANALFGVLDSEYAKKMSETIDNIKQNEDHLLDLIRNQTSVMDATVNIIKRDHQIFERQVEMLEGHVNQLTEQVNGIHEELYQEKLSQLFTSLTMQTMLITTSFQGVQASLLDVITDTHHGKISPRLISPTQLRQELRNIKEHLPSTLMLPVAPEDVRKLYNLMSIEGRPLSKHVIFRIKLPLIAAEKFELFRIIAVPVLINNTFLTIRPSSPYLIVNLHRDQYYPLTTPELSSCISLTEDNHLCKQNHPLYRKGSSISKCEIQLLNQLPHSEACHIEKSGDGPHWIQLHSPNQWIYSLRNRTTVNIVCNSDVTQSTIEGSGLLKMQDNCIIKQRLITIQGRKVYSTSLNLAYTPTTNLSERIMQLKPRLASTIHLNSIEDQHQLTWDSIKEQLQEIKRQSIKIKPHDIHQFALGYTGLVIALAIICVLIWYSCTLARNKPRNHQIQGKSLETRARDEDTFNIDPNVYP